MKTAKKTNGKGLAEYDAFRLRGQLEYVLRDARTGEIVKRGKRHNVVTAAGRSWALGRIVNIAADSYLTAIAFGSISTGATSNDSAMNGYDTCVAFNNGTTLSTATNAPCTFSASVSLASNSTWTNSTRIGEFALFNNTTNSTCTLFNHITTASYIDFRSTNTLAVTITITN